MPSATCIVIVDPYSSGALLAEALQAQGAKCVAVESSLSHPANMRPHYRPDTFPRVIQHAGDFDQTLASVRSLKPSHVLAGFESGVELAERLSTALSLPTASNRPGVLKARRDKFAMAGLAQAHGLRTPLQFQSEHVDELIDWASRTLSWPVIVKPPCSLASDMVHRCRDADEARRAAELIRTRENVLGIPNTAVLIQEFLEGDEFAVDIVSLRGRRKLTAIWQYSRPADTSRFICYDAMILQPYGGKRQNALQDFAFEVCNALAIDFGPAHCEIMWVAGAPVLIEVGARMTGGNNAILSRICGGICQLDETVDAVLNPTRFLTTLDSTPTLSQRAANVFLFPKRPGTLKRTHGLDEIARLPTLHSMSVAQRRGEELKRVAGRVTLVHEDIRAIERDIEHIRALEEHGMFEMEVDVPSDGSRHSE